MTPVPEHVRRLAEERQRARAARDFATADEIRVRIREAGFEVADTPSGFDLTPLDEKAEARPVYARSADVPSRLGEPPAATFSVQWIMEGWPEDVQRGMASIRRHQGDRSVDQVVVDLTGSNGPWPDGVEVIAMDPAVGWAAGRNAGLRAASGRIVVLVDGSVEATGDVLGPLEAALEDSSVGVTGAFGIVTADLHEFHPSEGPDVDAVEAYVMAFRRELVELELRFDEKFRFYRTADIELSFRVKAMGLRATVTSIPVARHEHRMWANTPEHERARLSKRNFYRFLDRWRGRTDLLVSSGDR